MSFAIESGVPTVTGKRGRKPTEFPLDQMGAGDSFLIPCENEKKVIESWRRKFLVARKRFAEQYGPTAEAMKFTTAVVNGGLRVWRTE